MPQTDLLILLYEPTPHAVFATSVDGYSILLTQSKNPASSLTPLYLLPHIQSFKNNYWAYFKNKSSEQSTATTLVQVTTISCLDNKNSFKTGLLTCSPKIYYKPCNQSNLSKRKAF